MKAMEEVRGGCGDLTIASKDMARHLKGYREAADEARGTP